MSTLPPIDIPGTLPEDWIRLLNMLGTMLPANVDVSSLVITSTGDLVDYLTGDTYTPIYTVREVIIGWAKVGGANPADTTAVATRPITDIVAGTGGVVGNIVSAPGTMSYVKKGVILASVLAVLVTTIAPLTVTTEVQEECLRTVTDFTVDGENVPVYMDANGKVHIPEALAEAVRQTLIRMGAYNIGEEIDVIPAGVTIDPSWNWQMPVNVVVKNQGETLFKWRRESTGGSPSTLKIREYYVKTATKPVTAAYIYFGNTSQYIGTESFYWVSEEPFEIGERRYDLDSDIPYYDQSYASGNRKHTAETNNQFVFYRSTAHGDYGYTDPPNTGFITNGGLNDWSSVAQGTDIITSVGYNTRFEGLLYGGTVTGGTGVEGMDVTGKEDFGDTTKTLADLIQGLADKYATLANPTDNDPYNKDNWIPINAISDDVFTDGLPSDKTDPETQTGGDPDDNTKDEIIEELLKIIQDITGNPEPPDIPAGDTGDTPPAEPPVLDGSSNGLWTIYNPTKQEVQDFGAWLWSDTIIDQIVRQFNSPIDAIIGFHQIYCTPETGSSKTIKAGYLNSPVSALEVTDQYAEINCGQVSVNEYYENALDYDNTQVSIYLPFVGIVPLDTNIVMGSTLEVIYRIDVFTGTCLAQIKVIKQNSNAVMYAFEGNCAVQIPLTATTYTGMIGALISGISAGVSFAGGDMLHAVTSGISAVMSAGSGRTGTKQSGTMGSNAGALGIRIPYLIITRSASAMPAGFETLSGLPSTGLTALSSVSGFTVVRNVHLEGIPGTAEELEEIKSLLESGVIF